MTPATRDRRQATRQPRWYQRAACCVPLVAVLVSGCSTFQKAKEADHLRVELAQAQKDLGDARDQTAVLEKKLAARDAELAAVYAEKQQLRQRADELTVAKERLARDLQQQIGEYKAKLTMTERGLVITFLAEVLFDSGKAVIKPDGYEVLDKVAEVLATTVKDNAVAVEGHTDNDPITHSAWTSNWELSTHRALAVLHYFVDTRGLPPARFQVNGFGEYRPSDTNDTTAGRQQNRRVEIVILPKALTKQR